MSLSRFDQSDHIDQSGSAKETVSWKIGKNIEILGFFNCMGTKDRTLIDINHH